MSKNNRPFLLSVSAATVMSLLSPHSGAAEWTVTPRLNLRETYTDNVRLAPKGQEQDDFITEINPGLSLTGTGSRLKVTANYTMNNILYAHANDRSRIFHQLNAVGNAELIEDLFFLDGRASISQQNVSLFGPLAADNTNITGNRANVKTYGISPYLRHRFQNIASTELRYTHDEVDTNVGELLNSRADRILFRLDNGTAFKNLGWGLDYNHQEIDFSGARKIETERHSGTLRYLITPRFSLNATAGYERFNYLAFGKKPAGTFWSAGFSWAPTERTSIKASGGERFFGHTYSLEANHRTRLSLWNLSYNEDITTTRAQFLAPASVDTATFLDQLLLSSFPDPVLRHQIVEAFLSQGIPTSLSVPTNFFTNRFFLQKRLQMSVALTGTRNTVLFRLFTLSREAQSSPEEDAAFGTSNLLLNDSTKQTGANATWSLRISPTTSANLGVGYTRIHFQFTDRTDNDRIIRFGLAKQFQPKLNGTLELRRRDRDSSQIGGDFREDAITASLNMSF